MIHGQKVSIFIYGGIKLMSTGTIVTITLQKTSLMCKFHRNVQRFPSCVLGTCCKGSSWQVKMQITFVKYGN